jgi:hypothetical protein
MAAEIAALRAEVRQGLADMVATAAIVRDLRDELRRALTPRPVDLVTVAAAARLSGRSTETIRRWCALHQVGEMDDHGTFQVSLTRLRAHLLAQHGVLPAGLKTRA